VRIGNHYDSGKERRGEELGEGILVGIAEEHQCAEETSALFLFLFMFFSKIFDFFDG
jgi:hypothetical protein